MTSLNLIFIIIVIIKAGDRGCFRHYTDLMHRNKFTIHLKYLQNRRIVRHKIRAKFRMYWVNLLSTFGQNLTPFENDRRSNSPTWPEGSCNCTAAATAASTLRNFGQIGPEERREYELSQSWPVKVNRRCNPKLGLFIDVKCCPNYPNCLYI